MKKYICFLVAVLLFFALGSCKQRETEKSHCTELGVFQIEYEFMMLSNDCVGSDWKTEVTCNEKPIQSGGTVMTPLDTDIVLRGSVAEADKFPDTGSACAYIRPGDNVSGTIEITVRENRGRYADSEAVWQLRYWVTRVSE